MSNRFCIIGAGRFGYNVAVTLADNGMDVMVIDASESIVESLKDKVSQAICMRVTDEAALKSLGVESSDVAIVAMGENFAESIFVTAVLKMKLQIPKVITRSISQMHKDILELVGADLVILPEKEVGVRLANSLSLPFEPLFGLTEKYSLYQVDVDQKLAGIILSDLQNQGYKTLRCLGKKIGDSIEYLNDDYELKFGDHIVFYGSNKDISKYLNNH